MRSAHDHRDHYTHDAVDRSVSHLHALDLDDLAAELHRLVDVVLRNPTKADGFSRSTPGAEPGSGAAAIAEIDPETGKPLRPVKLTPVEAAGEARRAAQREAFDREVSNALTFFVEGTHALAAARRRLDAARAAQNDAGLESTTPGCVMMARVGGWDEVHRTVERLEQQTDPKTGKPVKDERGEPVMVKVRYPLGRKAYDYYNRHGRFPSRPECEAWRQGRKVRAR